MVLGIAHLLYQFSRPEGFASPRVYLKGFSANTKDPSVIISKVDIFAWVMLALKIRAASSGSGYTHARSALPRDTTL